MARGFESKGVESQRIDAEAREAQRSAKRRSPEEIEYDGKRNSLLSSRRGIVKELERSRNERYRETLRAALDHLDRQLASLGDKPAD